MSAVKTQIEQLITRLSRDPNDLEALTLLKRLYRQQGEISSLVTFLENWARDSANDQAASSTLQEAADAALKDLNDLERAWSLYSQALKRNPLNNAAFEQLCSILDNRGEYQKLLDLYSDYLRAIQSCKADPEYRAFLHYQRAEVINKRLKHPEQSLNDYHRAIDLDTTLLTAIYEARQIYIARGDLKRAVKLYEMEADAESDLERKVSLLNALAHMRAERLNDVEGAISTLRLALKEVPSDIETMHALASYLLERAKAKDPDGAALDYRKVAELFYQIAQLVSGEEAFDYLQRALGYAPYHDGALHLLEKFCANAGRTGILPVYWVAYIASAPEGPEVDQRRFRLCRAYADGHQYEEAVFCIEPLVEQGNRQAVKLLAELQVLEGRAVLPETLQPEPTPPIATIPVAEPESETVQTQETENTSQEFVTDEPTAINEAEPSGETVPPTPVVASEPPAAPTTTSRIEQLRVTVNALVKSQSYDDAAVGCREILALDPADPDAFAVLEGYYRKRRETTQLRDLLLSTTRVPGLSIEARKVRLREVAGLSETKLRDIEGAINAWKAVAALDPADNEASQSLKRLLEKSKSWNELVQVLDREALSATDTEVKAELLSQIAKIHQNKREDPHEAAEAYRQLYLLRPQDNETRDTLCDLLLLIENHTDAIPLLKERIEDPANAREKPGLLRKLAAIYIDKVSALEEGFEVCRQILEIAPKDLGALESMERIDHTLGRFDRLLDTLERRLELSSKTEMQELLIRMGGIADRELSDLERSAKYYSHALDLSPQPGELLDALANVLERARKYDETVELLREYAVLEKDPEVRAELLRRAARVLFGKVGDEKGAADIWKSVLEIVEDQEGLRFMRGFAEKEGDFAYLSEILNRLAIREEDKEERRDLLFERARVFDAKLKQPENALSILREIIHGIDPEYEPAIDKTIEVSSALGEYQDLADALEKKLAKEQSSESRVGLARRLADVYESQLKDTPRAIAALKAWATLQRDNPQPLHRLRSLLEATKNWKELVATLDGLLSLEKDDGERVVLTITAADVCHQKLQDANGAWNRLVPLVQQGDKTAQEALDRLARAAGLEEALAGVYVNLAQGSQDAQKQAVLWNTASRIYDEYLNNPLKALEASLRRFATDLTNRSYLAEVERLAARAKAWDRLSQVYERLIKGASSSEEKVELLLRNAELLDHQAKDPSGAFDRVMRACALDPSNDNLLEMAEVLGPRANRCDELLLVYDRRRVRSDNDEERVEFSLRAAKLSDEEIGDRERANAYLNQAWAFTESSPDLAERIEDTAREIDMARGKIGEAGARKALVNASRDMAGKATPAFGSWLVQRAAQLLHQEFDDDEGVFDLLRSGTSLFPLDNQLYAELESLAIRIKRLDALDVHLAKLFETALDSATGIKLLERRGSLLESVLQRPADAAEVYGKLLQLSPEHKDAKRGLHTCLKSAGRYQDLLLALEKELQRPRPRKDELDIRKKIAGIWEVELKNRWEALDAWKKISALDPADLDAASAIARLNQRSIVPPSDSDELSGAEGLPVKREVAATDIDEDEKKLIEELLSRDKTDGRRKVEQSATAPMAERASTLGAESRVVAPVVKKLQKELKTVKEETSPRLNELEQFIRQEHESNTPPTFNTSLVANENDVFSPSSAIPFEGRHDDSGAFEVVDDLVEEIELDSLSPISSLSVTPPALPAGRALDGPSKPPPTPPRRPKP